MHECMIREAYGEQRELEMRSVSSLLIRTCEAPRVCLYVFWEFIELVKIFLQFQKMCGKINKLQTFYFILFCILILDYLGRGGFA